MEPTITGLRANVYIVIIFMLLTSVSPRPFDCAANAAKYTERQNTEWEINWINFVCGIEWHWQLELFGWHFFFLSIDFVLVQLTITGNMQLCRQRHARCLRLMKNGKLAAFHWVNASDCSQSITRANIVTESVYSTNLRDDFIFSTRILLCDIFHDSCCANFAWKSSFSFDLIFIPINSLIFL